MCVCDNAVCDGIRWFPVTQFCCGSGSLEAEAEIRLDEFQIDTCLEEASRARVSEEGHELMIDHRRRRMLVINGDVGNWARLMRQIPADRQEGKYCRGRPEASSWARHDQSCDQWAHARWLLQETGASLDSVTFRLDQRYACMLAAASAALLKNGAPAIEVKIGSQCTRLDGPPQDRGRVCVFEFFFCLVSSLGYATSRDGTRTDGAECLGAIQLIRKSGSRVGHGRSLVEEHKT